MNRKRRVKIADFNPHLICVLCGGYFIDATTIIECLHSFCRACIVHYLETNRFCPICDVQVHKSKPLQNIRADNTLQDLVYKLVPGLYQAELRSRREYYESHPECPPRESSSEESFIYTPDECFSLTLEYYQECNHPLVKSQTPIKQEEPIAGDEDSRTAESRGNPTAVEDANQIPTLKNVSDLESGRNQVELSERRSEVMLPDADLYLNKDVPSKNKADSTCNTPDKESLSKDGVERVQQNKRLRLIEKECSVKKRHLRCPAAVTITHLQKLIRAKYDLGRNHPVEILYRDEPLSNHLTLIDVAYIYKWRRKGPLDLCFRILETINEHKLKQDVSSPSGFATLHPEGKRSDVMIPEIKNEVKSKIDDWKEVQLQISETGIMSVAGVSLERNNNLTSPNDKLLDPSAAEDPDSLRHVKSETANGGQTSTSSDKEITNTKLSTPQTQSSLTVEAKVSEEMPILAVQSQKSNVAVNTMTKQEQESPNAATHKANNSQPSLNSVQSKAECLVKKSNSTLSDNKTNNVGSEKRKSATLMKILDSCITAAKKAKLSPIIPCESLDLSLRPVLKEESAIPVSSDVANSNDASGKKPNAKLVPPISAVAVEHDKRHTHPTREEEKKAMTGLSSVITPAAPSKKSPNSNSMGYKTLKVPPKTWNPSITRSSYLNSKGSPDNANSNSTSTLSKTPEKVPKFFKMRNMPRYLGNPSSGVKPMYQVSADPGSGTQETSEPSGKSKQVVMKIDPKTLCPIVAVVPPLTSATTVISSSGKPFYSTPTVSDVVPSVVDVPKTSPRIKSNSPSRKSPGASNPSPPVNFSHAARTGSPFANAAHLNTALSARSSPATASNNILLNPSNYSINPATLNLLSSNLSFLPNASNFLYGNYSSFAPPIRPNLNMVSPVSGLPNVLTAFHAMPPSINMLFSHHRTNSGSGFAATTNRPQTPAVQRIPASKGNGNSVSSGYKATKSSNLPSPKNNQTAAAQKPANSHTMVKTINTYPLNASEKNPCETTLVHKKNSMHANEEVNSAKQINPRSELSSSNNNTNLAKCKNPNNNRTFIKEELNLPMIVAPVPVTVPDKCATAIEASSATDSTCQSEPQNPSPNLEVESLVALEKKVLPSSEIIDKQTEITKVSELPETNCEVDCSRETGLGATTIESKNT